MLARDPRIALREAGLSSSDGVLTFCVQVTETHSKHKAVCHELLG